MEEAVTIRAYKPRDDAAVWNLHREGMETTPEYLEVAPKYEDDLHHIEDVYLTPGSNFWVAEADGTLVGMAAIQRVDAATGRVRRTRVTAACRRQGIARQLLNTPERFCREQGYRRVILDTTEQQTAAHRLYERAGFVRIGERSLGAFRIFDYEKILI